MSVRNECDNGVVRLGEWYSADEYSEDCAAEAAALAALAEAVRGVIEVAKGAGLWRLGDGFGGRVHEELDRVAELAGLELPQPAEVEGGRKTVGRLSVVSLLAQRDGSECRYCGVVLAIDGNKGVAPTVDHVDPSGGDEASNLCLACRPCNSSKGDRLAPSR